jgi:hypothetical protein
LAKSAISRREKQIPCGLKPAGDEKSKRSDGTAEAVPFQKITQDAGPSGFAQGRL